MPEEKITIKIDKDGNISAHVEGILGPKCVDEVKELLEEIAYIQDITKTSEYYFEPKVKENDNIREKKRIKVGEKR